MITSQTLAEPYARFLAGLVSRHEGGREEGHSGRVVALTEDVLDVLAQEMTLPKESSYWPLAMATHDIGKLWVPADILRKPGPLSLAERAMMEQHTTMGKAALEKLAVSVAEAHPPQAVHWRIAAEVAGGHHERQDGKGYPAQLSGDDVALVLRVARAVDVVDALTERRAYREAHSMVRAFRLMEDDIGGFDTTVLEALKQAVTRRLFECK